jgi:hypothetical protein
MQSGTTSWTPGEGWEGFEPSRDLAALLWSLLRENDDWRFIDLGSGSFAGESTLDLSFVRLQFDSDKQVIEFSSTDGMAFEFASVLARAFELAQMESEGA